MSKKKTNKRARKRANIKPKNLQEVLLELQKAQMEQDKDNL